MSVRICLFVDFDVNTPEEAYAQLLTLMATTSSNTAWESTDEWYDADGNPVPVAQINAITEASL